MTDDADMLPKEFAGLETMQDAPDCAAHGVAAIALAMAMKYHDIGTVQDGTMYQQMKLEGKNLEPLHLDLVLETAEKLETWLVTSQQRIAQIVLDAIAQGVSDDRDLDGESAAPVGSGASEGASDGTPVQS